MKTASDILMTLTAIVAASMIMIACGNSNAEKAQSAQPQQQQYVPQQEQDTTAADSTAAVRDGSDIGGSQAGVAGPKSVATSASSAPSKAVPISSKQFKDSKKKALLIGVGTYQYREDWDKTLSSARDVELLAGSLGQAGYEVTTLIDHQATHEGIEKAFKELLRNCNAGDVVLIHFSGHGQQIKGGQQRNESDNLTETFVAYDARKEYRAGGYDGKRHFTDDEIDNYATLLRERLGKKGMLLLSFDTCHSGTMSRDAVETKKGDVWRSVDMPITIPNYKPVAQATARGALAPGIELSACQAGQLNFEYIIENKQNKSDAGNRYGSLSYMIYLALGDGKTEPRAIADYVMKNYKTKKVMTRQQPCVYNM